MGPLVVPGQDPGTYSEQGGGRGLGPRVTTPWQVARLGYWRGAPALHLHTEH